MRKHHFLAIAVVGALLSCDDSAPVTGPDPGPDPIPEGFYGLQKISGDGQTGAPGEPLADPYVVKVVDQFGGAVPGATVRFQILNNVGGSLTASSVVTDDQGDAYVTARLPNDPDATQSVLARMDSAANELTFTSRTTLAASGASVIRIVSGNGQKGPTGDSLPAPLVVEVSNTDGVAVPGVSVKWKVTSANGGSVRETPTLTDGQGLASNSWRLGDLPGTTDRVIAWIEPANAPPDTVFFSAEVTAEGEGATLRIIAGDDQKGIERDTLLDPLVVEVRDSVGIAVPGISVNWRVVSSNGGTIVQTPTLTDFQGLASNRWRVGGAPTDTLARDTVIAWIEPEFGEPDTVVFVARVTGIPWEIEIIQGAVETDNEYSEPEEIYGDTVFVAPKHWARQPFKGIVRDEAGREVRGAILTWTVTNREGSVGLEPEDGAGEEAVTLNTAEDGAITVWRRACDEDPGEDVCSTDGNWIGATLSIEKYPNVVPVTLDALIRESAAP